MTKTNVPYNLKDEVKLIEAAKKDADKFAPLYDQYYKPIFIFVFKKVKNEELTADLTSQVFLKAMLNIRKYKNQGHPFSSWLYRIAVNEVNMYYRKQKKTVYVEVRDTDVVTMMEEVEIGLETKSEREQLIELLNQLDESETQLIELRFFEKLSFKEIGDIFEITEPNAKVRIYRILKKLKKMLNFDSE